MKQTYKRPTDKQFNRKTYDTETDKKKYIQADKKKLIDRQTNTRQSDDNPLNYDRWQRDRMTKQKDRQTRTGRRNRETDRQQTIVGSQKINRRQRDRQKTAYRVLTWYSLKAYNELCSFAVRVCWSVKVFSITTSAMQKIIISMSWFDSRRRKN